jgi:hypothetical protein
MKMVTSMYNEILIIMKYYYIHNISDTPLKCHIWYVVGDKLNFVWSQSVSGVSALIFLSPFTTSMEEGKKCFSSFGLEHHTEYKLMRISL